MNSIFKKQMNQKLNLIKFVSMKFIGFMMKTILFREESIQRFLLQHFKRNLIYLIVLFKQLSTQNRTIKISLLKYKYLLNILLLMMMIRSIIKLLRIYLICPLAVLLMNFKVLKIQVTTFLEIVLILRNESKICIISFKRIGVNTICQLKMK